MPKKATTKSTVQAVDATSPVTDAKSKVKKSRTPKTSKVVESADAVVKPVEVADVVPTDQQSDDSLGSTVVKESKNFWAAPFELGNEFGGYGPAREFKDLNVGISFPFCDVPINSYDIDLGYLLTKSSKNNIISSYLVNPLFFLNAGVGIGMSKSGKNLLVIFFESWDFEVKINPNREMKNMMYLYFIKKLFEPLTLIYFHFLGIQLQKHL